MEKFLQAAAMAWNPLGQIRQRLENDTLTFSSILAPFLGIVIVSNLVALGGQKFFMESLLSVYGAELPADPFLNSEYAQQVLSVIGVLVPVGVVALLPSGVFGRAGKNRTVSALIIVMAASAFYGAAVGAPIHVLSGLWVVGSPDTGLVLYGILGMSASIAVLGLTLFFWFRTLSGILQLQGGQVAAITAVAVVGLVVVMVLFGLATVSSV